MSDLTPKRTFVHAIKMSALGQKETSSSLLDQLISERKHWLAAPRSIIDLCAQ